MNRDIAGIFWRFANQQRQREFQAWCALSDKSGRENEKQAEAHRLKCGQWAEACNELYSQMNPTIKTGVPT